MQIQWMSYGLMGLMCMNVPLWATSVHEQLQVPHCLAEKITVPHKIVAENKQFQIIDIPESKIDALSHLADHLGCGRFVNVTHRLREESAQIILQKKRPIAQYHDAVYEIKHQDQVHWALQDIVPNNIWYTVSQLTSFPNRSASKKTGVKAAYWLKDAFEAMALENERTDATTFFVDTVRYKQPSLVTVIGKDIKAPAIVIGAHMDTLDGYMPGAGDDASGSASIMEMARILLSSKLPLKRPIYIIWYAAEERGLVGSQYVVSHFQKNSIPVKAAIQFDMTGYRANPEDPTMWVFRDYTNPNLNQFVAQLIETYIHVPVDYSTCGYGCSDHASWHAIGVPSAFPCESNFEDHNPYIHSSSDTIELLNLEHMTNFTKLALAFAIELALE